MRDELNRTLFRLVDAVFSGSAGPALVPDIYLAIQSIDNTLLQAAALSIIKKAHVEKDKKVIAVLQSEAFCYFTRWITPNSPKSCLFYLKHCVLTGFIIIQVRKTELVAKIAFSNNDGTFLYMKHSKKDNYSWNTLNRLLKICTTKAIGLINVVVDSEVEKHLNFHRKRFAFADLFSCKKSSHICMHGLEFYMFLLYNNLLRHQTPFI